MSTGIYVGQFLRD